MLTEILAYHLTNAKENLIKETAGLNVNNDQNKQMAFTHQGERPSIIFGHGLQHDHVKFFFERTVFDLKWIVLQERIGNHIQFGSWT